MSVPLCFFFFSSRRRHTRLTCDWSSVVCSSDLDEAFEAGPEELLTDADDLLDAGHTDAREGHVDRGPLGLDVWCGSGKFHRMDDRQIGRASCRGRGEVLGGGG